MNNLPEPRGELFTNEPLARYTSWRVGGAARQLYRPADLHDLQLFLETLPEDEDILWVGLGSNLLIRDGGFPGTVILTQGRLNASRFLSDHGFYVEAGMSCAQVARKAARNGLCGAAFLAGIPGTMGGALAMNAGAFGGETWQRVRKVQTINRRGFIQDHVPADFDVQYREVRRPDDEWFISCELQLDQGDADKELKEIRHLLDQRGETQPIGQASGGSTFRNPEGHHAARLIEQAGLKGLRVGGASVSEKHANFIINTGDATATDIEALIELVQEKVDQIHGVKLVPEVHMVGVAT